jgi:acetyl esterase/lipase
MFWRIHRCRAERGFRPGVIGLESRELPSGIAPPAATRGEPTVRNPLERLHRRAAIEVPAALRLAPAATDRVSGTVKVVSNLAYTRDGSRLDVYAPASGTPPPGGWPVILAIPGGGWRKARRSDIAGKTAGLTAQGFVVVPIDHVYDHPGGPSTWPAAIDDVRDAIRWVRHNAVALHVNPDKLVALGDSSGGHMAALAGLLPDGPVSADGLPAPKGAAVSNSKISTRVEAVVDFYAPIDLAAEWNAEPNARPYLLSFLGGSPGQVPGRYRAASPITYVNPNSPPVFIAQGTADTTVPASQSKEFAIALASAGVKHELVLVPGAPHGFFFGLQSRNMRNLVAFLDSVLGLPARG